MNCIKCINCDNRGQPGLDITLRRSGVVEGTLNMARYVAICNDCVRAENVEKAANEYKRAKAGSPANSGGMAG